MLITKSSGKKVRFDHKRIIKTCRRSGLSKKECEHVAKEVENKLYEDISTREILKITLSEIKSMNKVAAMKYDLKGAIMRLGPTGFVFEKFISRLLKELGYQTKNNIIAQGACVKHEIDIVAKKNNLAMIECKYHNSSGIYTGIKDGLYMYARFLDLKDGYRSGRCENFSKAWLASNTKFSTDVKKYAQCKGLVLLGWNYPKPGLAELIEKTGLYPITILHSVDEKIKNQLISNNIVTVKDLLKSGKKLNLYKVFQEAEQLTG